MINCCHQLELRARNAGSPVSALTKMRIVAARLQSVLRLLLPSRLFILLVWGANSSKMIDDAPAA